MALELAHLAGTLTQLRVDAAAAYTRARIAGMPAGVTSGYRTEAEQQDLYEKYLAGKGNFALKPDESNHVKGIALDLPGNENDPTTPRGWMKKYGRAHGWAQDGHEDWHFDYHPELDTFKEDDVELSDRIPLSGTAKDTLGMDAQSVGGALGYASAAFVVARRTEAKVDALTAALGAITGGAVDPAKIAAAVDKALADNFAAIPKQVNDDAARRLAQ